MGLCNAGEVLQHVLDGKLHGDSRSRVTPADQTFKVLVLTDEFVLHGVPHHLMDKSKGSEEDDEGDATLHVCSDSLYLQQTFLLTQVLVYFLVQVVQSLLHFFPRIFFDNFAQLLLVEGQVVAHLLLTDTLGHTGLNSLKEMLQSRHKHNSTERREQQPQIVATFPPTLSFSRGWPRELMT